MFLRILLYLLERKHIFEWYLKVLSRKLIKKNLRIKAFDYLLLKKCLSTTKFL